MDPAAIGSIYTDGVVCLRLILNKIGNGLPLYPLSPIGGEGASRYQNRRDRENSLSISGIVNKVWNYAHVLRDDGD